VYERVFFSIAKLVGERFSGDNFPLEESSSTQLPFCW
jgi:hypothetical protein